MEVSTVDANASILLRHAYINGLQIALYVVYVDSSCSLGSSRQKILHSTIKSKECVPTHTEKKIFSLLTELMHRSD